MVSKECKKTKKKERQNERASCIYVKSVTSDSVFSHFCKKKIK